MNICDLPNARGVGRVGSDEVFAVLIEAISTGRLAAGERLPSEEVLAAHFRVASMTLRMALSRLRDAGYVVTTRGRAGGTRVVADIAERLEHDALNLKVSLNELRVLTDWRRAISGEASYLAALRATPAEREELQRLETEFLQVLDVTTERRFADSLLHIHIAKMSGNPWLLQAEREIQEQLTRFIRITPLPEIKLAPADMGHSELNRAIIAGDPEAARAALLEHVEITYLWGTRQAHIIGQRNQNEVPLEHVGPISDAEITRALRQRPAL